LQHPQVVLDGLAVDHLLENVLQVTATAITASSENKRINILNPSDNQQDSSTAATARLFPRPSISSPANVSLCLYQIPIVDVHGNVRTSATQVGPTL
jgi:hypothetical protein